MPELPEVEIIRSGLNKLIANKTIVDVVVLNEKSFQSATNDIDTFVGNATINSVRRRAKMIMIDLSSGYTMVIHLKMTGQLIVRGSTKDTDSFAGGHPSDSMISPLPDRHTRVVFNLVDGQGREATLFFNDMRKFGWIKLLPAALLDEEKFITKLGPEPLVGHPQKEFIQRIRRRKNSMIKAAILNQEVLAGVGNIYVDEALWGAKIHPATRVKHLTESELLTVLDEAIKVMTLSIKKGGSTDRNYLNAEGKRGSYLEFAQVFRREGSPCKRCHEQIIKIRVAGRGTHICPSCQVEIKGGE